MTESLKFRPCHRLHHKVEFDRVYRAGRRAGDALFAVNAIANPLGLARLGMSVSTRSAGNSVRRNRIRRLIREVFRLNRSQLPPLDYVVTSRQGVRDANTGAIVTSLERLFLDATRRAVAVSAS